MRKCMEQIQYRASEPALFAVKGNAMKPEVWLNELKNRLSPKVEMIVLLLPGQRGKS